MTGRVELLATRERRMGPCPECGAPERDGRPCRQQWDELLALEFSDARAGSAHVLTVACYQLQHPQAFPLTAEARHELEQVLGEFVEEGRSVSAVRDAVQQRYDGARRVLGATVDPAVPRSWSRTVAAVCPPDAEHHAERVEAWAAAVYADLVGDGTEAADHLPSSR